VSFGDDVATTLTLRKSRAHLRRSGTHDDATLTVSRSWHAALPQGSWLLNHVLRFVLLAIVEKDNIHETSLWFASALFTSPRIVADITSIHILVPT
jgi:hypothetical protein